MTARTKPGCGLVGGDEGSFVTVIVGCCCICCCNCCIVLETETAPVLVLGFVFVLAVLICVAVGFVADVVALCPVTGLLYVDRCADRGEVCVCA